MKTKYLFIRTLYPQFWIWEAAIVCKMQSEVEFFFLLNVFLQKPENAMRFLGQLMTGPFCHCTWQKAIVGVSFRKLHQNCKSTVGLNAQWKHTLVLIEDIQVLHLHLGGVTIALIARGNGTNTWRAVSFTVQTPDPV